MRKHGLSPRSQSGNVDAKVPRLDAGAFGEAQSTGVVTGEALTTSEAQSTGVVSGQAQPTGEAQSTGAVSGQAQTTDELLELPLSGSSSVAMQTIPDFQVDPQGIYTHCKIKPTVSKKPVGLLQSKKAEKLNATSKALAASEQNRAALAEEFAASEQNRAALAEKVAASEQNRVALEKELAALKLENEDAKDRKQAEDSLRNGKVEFNEGKKSSNPFRSMVFFLMGVLGPVLRDIWVVTKDTIMRVYVSVLPSEEAKNFYQEKYRYHLGWFLGKFREYAPPGVTHMIDSVDSRDMRIKRDFGFVCISACLYQIFLFVMSFTSCLGVVYDIVEESTGLFTTANTTVFAGFQNVPIRKAELIQDAWLSLVTITISICVIHNNTVKYGFLALSVWSAWALVFIVNEFLLLITQKELFCTLVINAKVLNQTQVAMLTGALENYK